MEWVLKTPGHLSIITCVGRTLAALHIYYPWIYLSVYKDPGTAGGGNVVSFVHLVFTCYLCSDHYALYKFDDLLLFTLYCGGVPVSAFVYCDILQGHLVCGIKQVIWFSYLYH